MPQKRNPGKRRKIRPCSSKEVCEGTGDNAASITLLPVATQSLDPRHWNYTLTLPNHTTFLSVCYHGRNKITHNTKFKKIAFSNYGVRLELFCCISTWVVSMALKYAASGCLALHFIPPLAAPQICGSNWNFEWIAFLWSGFFSGQFQIKNQFCNNLFLFHHMCLKIMSGKLESTKVESPVALAVLCWSARFRTGVVKGYYLTLSDHIKCL